MKNKPPIDASLEELLAQYADGSFPAFEEFYTRTKKLVNLIKLSHQKFILLSWSDRNYDTKIL